LDALIRVVPDQKTDPVPVTPQDPSKPDRPDTPGIPDPNRPDHPDAPAKPDPNKPGPPDIPAKPIPDAANPTTIEPNPTSSPSSCTLRTISNCRIGCTATATTTLEGAERQAQHDACTTVCEAPITCCGATGVISTSTSTSTTIAIQKCAQDCAGCTYEVRRLYSVTVPAGYSQAPNSVLVLPAPTVTGSASNRQYYCSIRAISCTVRADWKACTY
jgi:hypothetical protein